MLNILAIFALVSVAFLPSISFAQVVWSEVRAGIIGPGTTKSEDELKAEIAAQPTNVGPYLQLAQLYRSNNRLEDAERVLRQALPLVPGTSVFPSLIGLYSPVYNPDRVLAIAEEWFRADSNNALPLVMAANAYVELARRSRPTPLEAQPNIEHAMQTIEEARRVNPGHPAIDSAHANVLRMRAELETDPTARAALLEEAEQLMLRTRSRAMQWSSSGQSAFHRSRADSPGAVRVGGNIRPPAKIKDVKPETPPEAQAAGVQGVVIVEVTIGTDGKVADARILRSIPLLDQAALDAVRQWEFAPTELNGQATVVTMTATVNFTLR